MEIRFGNHSTEYRFVPKDETYLQHVEVIYRERGGYDGAPTGISYWRWFDPENIPNIIRRLKEIEFEYRAWRDAEIQKREELGD